MLHIITESNKELKNRVFPLPDGVRKILQKTLEEYNGDKTIEGYKKGENGISDTIYKKVTTAKEKIDAILNTNKGDGSNN